MKKNLILIVTLLIICLYPINNVKAFSNPTYVSLNELNRNETLIIPLNASKYRIEINVLEVRNYLTNVLLVISQSTEFFRTDISDYDKSFDFTFTEISDYNFTFILKYNYTVDYSNLELAIYEIEEITTFYSTIHIEYITSTKTSIIAEAPYGTVFIILAVLFYALVKSKKRKG